MDLFASNRNTKVQKFYSLFYVPGTAGVDAFRYDWSDENAWAVPSFNQIASLMFHFEKLGSEAVLLVPVLPLASFWALFQMPRFLKMVQDSQDIPNASVVI